MLLTLFALRTPHRIHYVARMEKIFVRAVTRPDVFKRLNAEGVSQDLRKGINRLGKSLLLFAMIIVMVRWDTLREFRELEAVGIGDVASYTLTLLAWGLAFGAFFTWQWWSKAKRRIKTELSGDLGKWDYDLEFDDESITTRDRLISQTFRWEAIERFEITPTTIRLYREKRMLWMFAHEYLGDQTFGALAEVVRARVPATGKV